MTCHNCKCDCKKFGFFGPERIQRYRCKQCGKSFSDIPEKPHGELRIPLDKAVQIVHMLVEGCGIRATARLADVHRDTVLAVLEVAGRKCARLMDKRVRNIAFDVVQADELFCFVHCKEKNNATQRRDIGEQYVYLAMHASSKFIINYTIPSTAISRSGFSQAALFPGMQKACLVMPIEITFSVFARSSASGAA